MAKPLLPNEPRQLDWDKETQLTERFLLPALADIEFFFLELRAQLDSELRQLQPTKTGKPYPLGQCLEISLAMEKKLVDVRAEQLSSRAADGHAAVAAFLRHDGTLRQIWGDLRSAYFQNAFLLGSLYLDVSNDTVVPTKPKVEILPFAEANLRAVEDYLHFAHLAKKYWRAEVYPNHVAPSLAPYVPLIVVFPDGVFQLLDATRYMVELTLADAFRPSEIALEALPMPADLFHRVRACLDGTVQALADHPQQGRSLALENCRQWRAEGVHDCIPRRNHAVQMVMAANQRIYRHLAAQSAGHATAPLPAPNPDLHPTGNPMPTIKIDHRDYELDQFSVDARNQLEMLLATENRLRELQRDTMITQTARNAYAAALAGLLPPPLAPGVS